MRLPAVVQVLGGAIVLAYVAFLMASPAGQNWTFYHFSLIPARFQPDGTFPYDPFDAWYQALGPLLGHAFLHGNWLHLGMNALAFVQAGPFVAQRLGWSRFLLLFFLSAIGGAVAYILINPNSQAPMVGASGAICGLFAAYFLSVRPSPRAALADPQIRNAIGVFLLVNVVLMGVLSAFGMLPIAWEAHLGGFIVGGLVYLAIGPRRRAGPWD